ncbi:MAG: tetratricopeptide repeat protein [Phycisphaeraceae bacterium]
MPIHRDKPIALGRLAGAFAALFVLGAGMPACQSPPSQGPDPARYRTIRAEPLRDTDAARAANDKGLAHLDRGELYQAEQAFLKALDADVEFGPAHNNLGKVYYLKRDFYRAAHEFDDAIKLMPQRAAPHNNLGLTLIEANKLDDAIERFRQAVQLDPGTIDYQANLARTLIQRGDRTAETVNLLRAVAALDTRIEWRVWARHELGLMGLD